MKTRRRRWLKWTLGTLLALVLLAFGLVNWVAYNHAYRLSHFEAKGITHDSIAGMDWRQKADLLLWGIPIQRPANHTSAREEGIDSLYLQGERGKLELWHLGDPQAAAMQAILFPGYTRTKSNLLRDARFYAGQGYEVWLVDFAGVGGSEGNVSTGGYLEALDVRDAVNEVRRRKPGRGILLHGSSMGSAAILRAVHDLGVKPDALVLETPFPDLVSALQHRLEYGGVPGTPLAQMVAFWGGWQQGYSGWDFAPEEYAKSVKCPVLQMAGQHDPLLPITESTRVHHALGTDQKEFSLIHTDEHGELYDLSSEEWEATLKPFLVEQRKWAEKRLPPAPPKQGKSRRTR